ncbi:MAG: acyl-protein synthetase [Deltaproteobacteria bacterium]|nr:acyl-protein synthetase [Deltaproteobacteria bacterium]
MTSPWTGAAAALAERVRAFVHSSLTGAPSEPFWDLALDLHRWQADNDPVLASLVEGEVRGWRDIPAVPVDLFKTFPVGTVPPGEEAVAFQTSGTTGSGRGTHRLRGTSLYNLGALTWAEAVVPDAPRDVVALLADPAESPESSLSHMVALFPRDGGRVTWHLRDGALDRDGINGRIEGATGPLYLAATAFALAEYLEDGPVRNLPPGSVVMVTGGLKGRTHRREGEPLYREALALLSPARLVREYGMTELSSQLWSVGPTGPYLAPPWLRVVAVDPLTGTPVPAGERGQLRFYDLCNLDGTVAIETMDEGVIDAEGGLTLFGRLEGSPARGCSLTVEEAWAARGRA